MNKTKLETPVLNYFFKSVTVPTDVYEKIKQGRKQLGIIDIPNPSL